MSVVPAEARADELPVLYRDQAETRVASHKGRRVNRFIGRAKTDVFGAIRSRSTDSM